MLDLQKIQNAFADNRTEEQKAFDAKQVGHCRGNCAEIPATWDRLPAHCHE
jgi:hypothetical protein